LSDLLFGYDSLNDAIAYFVKITEDGIDSRVLVGVDGRGRQLYPDSHNYQSNWIA